MRRKFPVNRRHLSPKIHIPLKDFHIYHHWLPGLEKEGSRTGRGQKEVRGGDLWWATLSVSAHSLWVRQEGQAQAISQCASAASNLEGWIHISPWTKQARFCSLRCSPQLLEGSPLQEWVSMMDFASPGGLGGIGSEQTLCRHLLPLLPSGAMSFVPDAGVSSPQHPWNSSRLSR